MASKSNIRSIRISDDMLELIEQQAGNNFTEKWENLVTRCIWELPMQEQKLEQIQKQIQNEQEQLDQLHTLYRKLKMIFDDMQRKMGSLVVSIDHAIKKLDY